MIKLTGLSKHFDIAGERVEALQNINLEINSGEIFGIIGSSGAGKSTLLRCINMLEQPSDGSVVVNTLNMTMMAEAELRAARRHIGMIFQHFNLLQLRTVFENVALPLEFLGHTPDEINSTVTSILELVGLSDKNDAYPHQLSGGQKQRVAIARALASKPKVLLCDEATSSLDPKTTESILQLLQKINKDLQLTVVLITHEMDVIKSICDRVAVLDKGQIIESGSTVTIFTQPKAMVTKEFVRAALRDELPQALQRRLEPCKADGLHPVLRVAFTGKTASQPIIGHLIQEFKLSVNIVQANIETVGQVMVGVMVMEISGPDATIEQGLRYLESKNLNIDIIGYVASNI